MTALIFNILFAVFIPDFSFQETYIQNIEQITFPEMGFEKAGEAYFSPDGNTISFQAVPIGENDYQIYTLNLNNRKLSKISKNAGACTCSFFHPNGNRIIYAKSPFKTPESVPGVYKWDFTPYMNIYESDLDGSNSVQLTFGPAYHAECAYSPDGTKIVYASNESGSMNLHIMNSDGTNMKQITHSNYCYNGGPFFSPDGSEIIYRADCDTPHQLQIYKVDINGENLVQLTDNKAVNWAPFWYPTGNAIAYTTSLHGHFQYQIYMLHLKTNESVRITYFPTFNGLPTFNYDGTKLLWTSKRGVDNTSQIFMADFIYPFKES